MLVHSTVACVAVAGGVQLKAVSLSEHCHRLVVLFLHLLIDVHPGAGAAVVQTLFSLVAVIVQDRMHLPDRVVGANHTLEPFVLLLPVDANTIAHERVCRPGLGHRASLRLPATILIIPLHLHLHLCHFIAVDIRLPVCLRASSATEIAGLRTSRLILPPAAARRSAGKRG